MKKVEFRGKRFKEEEWVYGDLTHLGDNEVNISPLTDGGITSFTYAVIPETIGMFTGLTDKKGAKWFEDDVLKSDNDEIIICFLNGGFGYWHCGDFIGFAGHNHLDMLLERFTVMGTIHEK